MPEFKFLHGNLLVSAVGALANVEGSSKINFSPEELSLTVRTDTDFLNAAFRIKSLAFSHFDCNHNRSALIDLRSVFLDLANNVYPETVLTIRADEELFDFIDFEFESLYMEDHFYSHIQVTPTINENVINEFQYEYDVGVGMPSEEFRRVISHLSAFGDRAVTVTVTIDHAIVMFRVEGGGTIGLSTEHNECVIRSVAVGDRFPGMFNLHHVASLWEASYLSGSVWMFQSETLPFQLNFPVRPFANIMYYFP